MENTEINLFVLAICIGVLALISFDLIPYLRKMSVKLQSSGHLTDCGSH